MDVWFIQKMEGEAGVEERNAFQEDLDMLISLLPRLGHMSLQIVAKEATEDLVRKLLDSQFLETEDLVQLIDAVQNEGKQRVTAARIGARARQAFDPSEFQGFQ
jgi:hypothetical protein